MHTGELVFIASVFCPTGGGQPFLRHGRVRFPEQRDALPMQVRRGAGLHARLPRRYGRKTIPAAHSHAAPSHFHHAFLFFSCQATLTAPRRKTCLTTSVKSPTTSCELRWWGGTRNQRGDNSATSCHTSTHRGKVQRRGRRFNGGMNDDEGGERYGSSQRMIAASSFTDTHRKGRRQYRKRRT